MHMLEVSLRSLSHPGGAGSSRSLKSGTDSAISACMHPASDQAECTDSVRKHPGKACMYGLKAHRDSHIACVGLGVITG